MNSDFDGLAKTLESCLLPPQQRLPDGPTLIAQELATAALTFLSTPSRTMIDAARAVSPELTPEQVDRILRAVADAVRFS